MQRTELRRKLTEQLVRKIGFESLEDRTTKVKRRQFTEAIPLLLELKSSIAEAYGKKHRMLEVYKCKLQVQHVLIVLRHMLKDQRQYILYNRTPEKVNGIWKTTYQYFLIG